MEELLRDLAHYVALAADAIAVVVVAIGSLEALIGVTRVLLTPSRAPAKRAVWLNYARWLVAGLTFQLAADIVETTMTPTWDDIGRVAAVAAIRTMLTYFLDRDIETMGARLTGRAAEESEGKRRTVA